MMQIGLAELPCTQVQSHLSSSLLLLEKLLVVIAMVARLKNGSSRSSLWPSMFWSNILFFFIFSDNSKMHFTL